VSYQFSKYLVSVM